MIKALVVALAIGFGAGQPVLSEVCPVLLPVCIHLPTVTIPLPLPAPLPNEIVLPPALPSPLPPPISEPVPVPRLPVVVQSVEPPAVPEPAPEQPVPPAPEPPIQAPVQPVPVPVPVPVPEVVEPEQAEPEPEPEPSQAPLAVPALPNTDSEPKSVPEFHNIIGDAAQQFPDLALPIAILAILATEAIYRRRVAKKNAAVLSSKT